MSESSNGDDAPETPAGPWAEPMPEEQFARMREILRAPSPIGLEGAMTFGVIVPQVESFAPDGWAIHRFRGNAGAVIDTAPTDDDALKVMVIGHADKIRLQVKSVGKDGKIWLASDSFMASTLIGHEVTLFSEDPESPGSYREIRGGTVEALGAIHLAERPLREGAKGVKPEKLYLELQLHGKKRREQVEALGVRPGDPLLLDRPIKRGFAPDSFYGAYLDNGLGCFVVSEMARLLAAGEPLQKVRFLGAIAAYEEIGRFGSRVLAGELRPDVVIGVDVNHDFDAAPGVADKRYPSLAMGDGMTMTVGSIATPAINAVLQRVCKREGIPLQLSVAGRDTGTDAMAGVLASIDAAATSVGFPIRNMHTISETAHTGDVLACIHGLHRALVEMDASGLTADDLRAAHVRLDEASPQAHQPAGGDD